MDERKRKVRIGRLTNLGQIASEIARVYRQSRRDELDSMTAYRLATILGIMAKTLETSELEKRLNDIEAMLIAREQPFRPKIVS